MQKLNTAAQMRHMDQTAMHGIYAIAPAILMENAGHAVVEKGDAFVGGWGGKDVVILCGKGNNGGDGFVIARQLLTAGARVYVYILGQPEDYSEEACDHLTTLRQLADEDLCILEFFQGRPCDWGLLTKRLEASQVVIDALLGTGFHGDLREPMSRIVAIVNAVAATGSLQVIAVDIPTGVNADTGAVSGAGSDEENGPLFADLTVTFGALKRGLVFYPGRACAGQIELDAIGMPWPLLQAQEADPTYLLMEQDIAEVLVPRRPDSHKGTHGTIAIVTGSSDMAGAALMAVRGAIRSGAGKVFLRVPKETAGYCIGKEIEAMVHGIGTGDHFTAADAEEILADCRTKRWSVIAMGPGLGVHEETKAFVKAVIAGTTCPIVLDADALNVLTGEREFLAPYGSRLILTPHLAEFSRLSGFSMADIEADPLGKAKEFVRQWHVNLVLKGAPTVIVSAKTCHAYVNPTGNAGMACGGMGDILTGMTASFAVHAGLPDLCSAACAAVYVHGAAGDYCHDEYGSYGFSPVDVADAVPRVIRRLEENMERPVLQRPLVTED